jgi:diguanylate cyclase (GGDEF)-like protein
MQSATSVSQRPRHTHMLGLNGGDISETKPETSETLIAPPRNPPDTLPDVYGWRNLAMTVLASLIREGTLDGMMSSGDELIFAAETADEEPAHGRAADPWRVLVVDDDPDVFRVTELSLKRLRFRGRAVQLLTASSAGAARAQLGPECNIALALIDVVMETETAGLDLIRTIRTELGLNDMRIILRTGQPGQAPERDVILNYDIDGYAAKAEMTAMKLFTTVVAALRAYETVSNLSRLTAELEKRVAARTAELEKLAMIDALTGVANRRHFEIRATVEVEHARGSGAALGAVMMDIDHFKCINDCYGHAAGDAVLKQLVDVVTPQLRPGDLFARIGGEEFALLLPGSDRENSLAVAERVGRAVAAAQIEGGGLRIPVTLSLGVCALADEDKDIGPLLSRADHALYRAKAAGRNRALLGDQRDRVPCECSC